MNQKQLILIAGFGYIAKKLVEQLDEQAVCTLSRSKIIHKKEYHQHLIIDLDTNDEINLSIDKNLKISIIYLVPPNNTQDNDLRILNFIKALAPVQNQISQFILISTTAVYGHCKGNWVDEESPVSLKLSKAKRRYYMEQASEDFCKQNSIPLTILRVAGIYAQDKLPLNRLLQALPILNVSESPYSNRIHADDLVSIIMAAMTEGHPGIYNCSDSSPSTMSEYFIQLAHALNYPEPPQISFEQAKKQLSPQMMNYLSESRRISNKKLLTNFKLELKYPSLTIFLNKNKLI
ncbi:MAG: NAD-dependent epimerase/dehydratase family protein [Gammaproteobacteria bacterium]|nr:NAD-dependent epimerase/dehydratase family protein [Gammaproteobacteria bacterium]